jgi:hypothetical protein
MLCLLRLENLNEAKYLWKRSLDPFKGTRNSANTSSTTSSSASAQENNNSDGNQKNLFALSWEIGKLLFQEEIGKALKLIQSTDNRWKDSNNTLVQMIVEDLFDHYVQKILLSLSVAYNPFVVNTVMKYLEINEQEAKECELPLVNYSSPYN